MKLELTTSRQAELESLFNMCPDVPREAIIKADLLRLGMKFTKAGLEKASAGRPRSYYIFSYDVAALGEMEHGENQKAPDEIRFSGGVYNLRPTLVASRINPASPYVVDARDGELVLVTDDAPNTILGKGETPPTPRYYSKSFEDGTRYAETMAVTGWGHRAFSTVMRTCGYWGSKEECKFCDMNSNARAQIKSGRPYTMKKKIDQVAEAAAEVFLNQHDDEPRRIWLCVSGGTLVNRHKPGQEIEDEDFYLPYIEAMRAKIGNRWPISLQTAAKDKATYKRMRDAGVSGAHPNVEVWDRRLFGIIAPGKDHFIGYDTWVRRMVDAVDVFGEGNVNPAMVAGIEMCQPWGFKTVAEAVKSTAEGFDFMMSHGVLPRPTAWCIEAGSALSDNSPPPLEFFVRLWAAWYETWKKYSLPPVMGFPQMGPGNSVYQNTAMLDYGH